jgi:hypothetical protein
MYILSRGVLSNLSVDNATYVSMALCGVTLEQYRARLQPVHLNNSCPISSSTVFDGTKHAEQAISRTLLSRTDISGSRLSNSDPPGTDSVEIKPLPND